MHVVKVGVFGPGWNGVAHWNDDAARITVAASGASTTVAPSTPTTTTTMKPTTTTQATTTTTTTMPPSTTSAPTATNGWTTSVTVDRTQVERGGAVTVTVNVASNKTTNALVDVEIYNGSTKSFQRFWDGQPFDGERQPSAHGDVDRAGERGDDGARREGGRLRAGLERHGLLERRCRVDHRGRFGRVDDDPAAGDDNNGEADDDHPADDHHQPTTATTTVTPTTTTARADDHSSADNRSLLHLAAGIGPAV